MSIICFYAQFVASKVGANSLTVTWDVEQITRSDGTRTALVTGGATTITIGRRGLYGYRLASADLSLYDYVATAITATTTVDQQEIAAIGMVIPDALVSVVETDTADIQTRLPAALIGGRMDATVGAMQNDTLTAAALATDAITEIAGAVLDEVYTTHATAYTLGAFLNATDPTTVTVTSSNDAGELTLYRGVTFAATVSGLTISASWTKIAFTVKTDLDLADTASTIQIVESNPGVGTDGLLYLNGAALASPITAADASLTVTQAAGTVAIALSDDATALLSRARSVHWDLKQWVSSATTLLTSGSADIELTPTRTV